MSEFAKLGRRLAVALVVGAIAVTGTLVPSASPVAAATGFAPPEGGIFNRPTGTRAEQTRIETAVLATIRHARPRSEIRISVYSFDRFPVADALIGAKRRGVSVQVLINGHQSTAAMRKLRRALGSDRAKRSFFYVCDDSCRGRGEYLHSKFFLFSRTGRVDNVVMAGSDNFMENANRNQWNDLFIHSGSARLYDRFSRVFDEMKRDRPAKRPHLVFPVGSRFELEVFPFPGVTRRNDPMMRAMQPVRCFNAAPHSGANGRTMVRVAMHSWRGARGVYLARRVRELYANGCDVKIMYGMTDVNVRGVFAHRTQRGYVPVRRNGSDSNLDGKIDKYAHEKVLSISGHYGRTLGENRIYTGSSNWSSRGLSGDEIILRVRGRGVFLQYLRSFNTIWREAGRDVRYQRSRTADGSTVYRDTTTMPIDRDVWEND